MRYHNRHEDPFREYDHINWEIRDSFKEGVKNEYSGKIINAFEKTSIELAEETNEIRILLDDYLIRGGYPEVVTINDYYKTTQTLRDYLSLTIYKDIVKTFRIRDPKTFESLFSILASECCNKHNYTNLSNALGVKRSTVKDYLFYLTQSYLIFESKFYTKNIRKQSRNDKKIFVNDNGLRNTVLGLIDPNTLMDSIQIGKLVENTVADHCKRLKFSIGQGIGSESFTGITEEAKSTSY
ncbi:DUF4143 domain-containing protein [Candidatus Bathyarchaeota archaeon]|nr:DUF4143 domain-containing protein [Candidatus Bathyarchaeota archaeon]